MKKSYTFFLLLFGLQSLVAQQKASDSTLVDLRYREDQFYIGVTYNLLGNKPSGVSQRGFSTGFHLGVIRDMPINTNRNIAIGLGLGLSLNSYNQNVLISKNSDGTYNYSILDDNTVSFSKNKFSTYLIEIPLEFRWRTSNATDYNFWRIYTGVKFGYVVFNSSKFKGSLGDQKNSSIDDFNALQYGLTLSVGYSTWNANIYYGLNSIFNNDAKIDNQNIDMTAIKIGLMFYLL